MAVAARTTPLVGREAELGYLAELLDRVGAGEPRVVLVEGSAGIGKTALIRAFVAAHADLRTVWASGDESESLLSFGVIDQMRRQGRGEGAHALGAGPDGRVEPLEAGARLLEWVGQLAAAGPLALVVDDAHWADRPSLDAVAFALRRLVAERVLTIFVCRDERLSQLPAALQRVLTGEASARLGLGGLGEEDLVALARERRGSRIGLNAARRLRDHTGGNPLHVHALLDELGTRALADLDAGLLAGPLPAPASFAPLVLGRVAQMSPEGQALVAGASVLGMRWRRGEAARLVGVDEADAPLDEAIASGLVELAPPWHTPCFSHPLIQAAVYHDLSPGRRSALHRAAAAMAPSREEELRHRVAACVGPDSELAGEVAEMAEDHAGRGAWDAAAAGFLSAARLDPGDGATRWFLSAVDCLVRAGDAPAALALRGRLEQVRPCAQRDYVRGFLASVSGQRAAGKELLEQAWARAGEDEQGVAATIANQLAMVALNEGRGADAVEWARRALRCDPGTVDRGMARAVESFAFGELGRFEEGLATSRDLPADPLDFDAGDMGALLGRGVLALWQDRLERAGHDLTMAEDIAHRLGPLFLRIITLFYLADAEYRVGRWDEASAHAELATSLGEDAGEVWTLGLSHSVAVFPAAGRGEWDRAELHLGAATEAAAALGDPANTLWVATAAARLAQARQDHQGVLDATQAVIDLDMPTGREVVGIQPWALLRAEALVGSGRLPEAAELLGDLGGRAEAQGHATTRLGVLRLRGAVAAAGRDPSRAEQMFEEALDVAAGARVAPLEHALLELDHGSLLRRSGRRKMAAEHLGRAHSLLARLAAVPFLTRCERELGACGVSPSRPADAFHARLSPQEQAVATLVATGLTNREVASRLIVSTKAVEFHLTNVFAKLGVRNRVELATRVAGVDAGPGPGTG